LKRVQNIRWINRLLMHEKQEGKAYLTSDDKDFMVYQLVESTVLNAGASLKGSELRTQFDDVKGRLEGLREELGEEYIARMQDRLEQLWREKSFGHRTPRDTGFPGY
jgi:hypothetical protein